MDRKKLFLRLAFVIFLVFFMNFFAGKFYWYYTIWYFDIVMHILGGFFVGLLIFGLLNIKDISFNNIFKIIFGVLMVGIAWELFEFVFSNIIAQESFNFLDTISDVFCDLAGSILAVIYFSKRIILKENNV